jgi:hypothetical protein
MAAGRGTASPSQEITVIGKPVRERDRDHLASWPHSPVLSAAAPLQIPTTSSSWSSGRWAEKSVTASPSPSADCTIVGNERAWWQKQAIDPQLIAANLWAKTHAATPAIGLAADIDRPVNVNGSDSGAVVRPQIDETKPMLRPEAG